MSIIIRKELPGDIESIHDVTVAAFLDAPHTDHTEQFIVKALRESDTLSVSLVAQEFENIVGHVAISPIQISDGTNDWYGLGPISVAPNKQGKGIGSQLVNATLDELRKLKAKGCVLLGDPNFYQRFGFKPLDGLILPDVPAEYFQALIFQGKCPQGTVNYHKSFYVQS